MSGIQWGDVGTWVAGLATAGGLVFTGLALRAQLGQFKLQSIQFREAEADRRRSQASVVAVWPEKDSLFGASTPRTPNDAFIRYRNASQSPAYEGIVTIDTSPITGTSGSTIVRRIDVFRPHDLDELIVDTGFPVGDHLLPVDVLFRDANGVAWRRTARGELSEVGPQLENLSF